METFKVSSYPFLFFTLSIKPRLHKILAHGGRLKDSASLWDHSGMSFSWLWNHKRTFCDDILMWDVGESYWREGKITSFSRK
jgi:hypothetical protein